jgi:hypothetical protein
MKQVDLPLMAISVDLDTALARLKKSKRSALVSEESGRYSVFSAGSIVVGRSQGFKTLSELKLDPKLKPKIMITEISVPVQKKTKKGGERVPSRSGATRTKKAAGKPATRLASDFVLRPCPHRDGYTVISAR